MYNIHHTVLNCEKYESPQELINVPHHAEVSVQTKTLHLYRVFRNVSHIFEMLLEQISVYALIFST